MERGLDKSLGVDACRNSGNNRTPSVAVPLRELLSTSSCPNSSPLEKVSRAIEALNIDNPHPRDDVFYNNIDEGEDAVMKDCGRRMSSLDDSFPEIEWMFSSSEAGVDKDNDAFACFSGERNIIEDGDSTMSVGEKAPDRLGSSVSSATSSLTDSPYPVSDSEMQAGFPALWKHARAVLDQSLELTKEHRRRQVVPSASTFKSGCLGDNKFTSAQSIQPDQHMLSSQPKVLKRCNAFQDSLSELGEEPQCSHTPSTTISAGELCQSLSSDCQTSSKPNPAKTRQGLFRFSYEVSFD